MTDKRLLLALPALLLLAACGGNAPANDSRSASGEVLEGTISDAMLPVDRVRSEPPLEDPAAFAEARSAREGAASSGAEDGEESSAEEPPESEGSEAPAAEAPTEAGAE